MNCSMTGQEKGDLLIFESQSGQTVQKKFYLKVQEQIIIV